jgi:hypothetical protein
MKYPFFRWDLVALLLSVTVAYITAENLKKCKLCRVQNTLLGIWKTQKGKK